MTRVDFWLTGCGHALMDYHSRPSVCPYTRNVLPSADGAASSLAVSGFINHAITLTLILDIVILALAVLSQYTRVTDRETDDQHTLYVYVSTAVYYQPRYGYILLDEICRAPAENLL